MNTIGRSQPTAVIRQDQNAVQLRKQLQKNIQVHAEGQNQDQNAVQIRKQLQKSEQGENIRNKQISKDIQVHTEGQKVDLLA